MQGQILLVARDEAAPLRRRILRELREAIIGGDLPPGSRLVESALMRRWSVSRTTIRDVLNQLEAEGIVCSALHKGAWVRGLSAAEVRELYVIRASLEGLAARLFSGRANPEDRRRLRAAFEQIAAAYNIDDPAMALAAKNEFYAVLSDGAGCRALSEMLGRVQAQIRLYRSAGLRHPGRAAARGKESVAHLMCLLEALDRGDGATAEQVMRREVESAASELLRFSQLFVN